jgi:hypothetical protein
MPGSACLLSLSLCMYYYLYGIKAIKHGAIRNTLASNDVFYNVLAITLVLGANIIMTNKLEC